MARKGASSTTQTPRSVDTSGRVNDLASAETPSGKRRGSGGDPQHALPKRANTGDRPIATSTANGTRGSERRRSTQPEAPMSARESSRSPNDHVVETAAGGDLINSSELSIPEKDADEQDRISEGDGKWYNRAKVGFKKLLKTSKPQVLPDSPTLKRAWTGLGRREAREVKTEDIRGDDVVIAVMGPTGAGKSSFISAAVGFDRGVGHDLKSCTSDISAVRVRVPDEDIEVVLVDTPGFSDTYKSDLEILKLISDWLKKTYENNVLLSGILYLHRISDIRMAGSPLKNLEMFKKLCGRDALSNIIMVTTMWSEVDEPGLGEQREKELINVFWKPMLQRGSTTARYDNTTESAWDILEHFLDAQRQQRITRLQNEMVDLKKSLNKTDAGHELYRHIEDILKAQDTRLRTLKKHIDKAQGDNIMAVLQRDYSQLENERKETLKEYQALGGSEARLKLSYARHLITPSRA